jgi:hypothetical protein
MKRIALAVALLATSIAAPASASIHHVVANADGDVFSIDVSNQMWVRDRYGTIRGAGSPHGWPYAHILHGIAPVQSSWGYKSAFVTGDTGLIGNNGKLWEAYWNGAAWVWADHGQPPCGYASGVSAASSGSYIGVFVVCNNGWVAERYYSNGGWYWADHGTPPATLAVGSPAMVSATGYTGVLIVASDGTVWERYYRNGWQWAAHGAPGTPLRPVASMTRNPVTGYTGGLFIGFDNHAYELYYAYGSTWLWVDHGTGPGGTGCASLTGGFSMASSTVSAEVLGVAGCSIANELGEIYDARLAFDRARGWFWTHSSPDPAMGFVSFARDVPYPSQYVRGAAFAYAAWSNGGFQVLNAVYFDEWNDLEAVGNRLANVEDTNGTWEYLSYLGNYNGYPGDYE